MPQQLQDVVGDLVLVIPAGALVALVWLLWHYTHRGEPPGTPRH